MAISGVLKTEKLEPKAYKKSYTFPIGVENVLVENTGDIPLFYWFDDDSESTAIKLKSDVKLPVFTVQGGKTKLNYKARIEGELSLFMWG